jgi:hypothetical protein
MKTLTLMTALAVVSLIGASTLAGPAEAASLSLAGAKGANAGIERVAAMKAKGQKENAMGNTTAPATAPTQAGNGNNGKTVTGHSNGSGSTTPRNPNNTVTAPQSPNPNPNGANGLTIIGTSPGP